MTGRHRIARGEMRAPPQAPESPQLRELGRALRAVRIEPSLDRRQFRHGRVQHVGITLRIGARRKVIAAILDGPGAVRDDARAERLLDHREKRIPDDPCIDRVVLERGPRVGRRQPDWRNVGVIELRRLQQPDQQEVRVRSLHQRDALAAQVREGLHRRILRNYQCLGRGAGRRLRVIDERRAGREREDRRCLTDIAEVDRSRVQCLELRRPRRKLGPRDGHAECRKLALQRTACLQQAERPFLIADAQRTRAGGARQREARMRGGARRDRQAGMQEPAAGCRVLVCHVVSGSMKRMQLRARMR